MSNQDQIVQIAELMQRSGVKFGTSGARGLASDMTDRVCYAYTLAFMQHLKSSGDLIAGASIAIAGDYRSSSPRIIAAVVMAVHDFGFTPINCGLIPTPAVACYAMDKGMASIMVTGSHIPDDRNGIKFYKPAGEILKEDEQGVCSQSVVIPEGLFSSDGSVNNPQTLADEEPEASRMFIQRYLDFFPAGCLKGRTVGVYEHSTVARDILGGIFQGLGATVVRLGRSEAFLPVDTEAIRPEDVLLAHQWAKELNVDSIVSADGDGDRPLISDEQGNWLRGDVAGILCARYLGAQYVATPVSCNSAVEKSGWFKQVDRTRIGSPFVIAAMNEALEKGTVDVVGYEANGGFLTASDITIDGRTLKALPTRDAVIVPLTILLMATEANTTISELLNTLPQRFTSSGRLKDFPTELSQSKLSALNSGSMDQDMVAADALFSDAFGPVASIDCTDGIRIIFQSAEVAHLRPSGNAPELRCYNEAASEARAEEMNSRCLAIIESWRSS
ncbi:MAG: phosphomannomutase [Mariprofundaceae bacterium]|nr:phosphomannomutase [Mariprofundaceae bacterium]